MTSLAIRPLPVARHRVRYEPQRDSSQALGPVKHRPVSELRASSRNARKHSKGQIAKLAGSIREFGFITPVLVTNKGEIIAGEARVSAAREVGLSTVPTIAIEHLTELQVRAYRLADNQLATLAGWDFATLATELGEIVAPGLKDVAMLGWEISELDKFLWPTSDRPVAAPSRRSDGTATPVSKMGDLWILNEHRLLCGSPLDMDAQERLMDGRKATLVAADIFDEARVSRRVGKRIDSDRISAGSSGVIGDDERQRLRLETVCAPLGDGGILQIFTDWRHLYDVQAAARKAGLTTLDLCVWSNNKSRTGGLYRSQYELVLILKKGSGPHISHVASGKGRRARTNVWDYPDDSWFAEHGMATRGSGRPSRPVALIADAIQDFTNPRAIVVDNGVGSGAAILAAEQTGRVAYCIDAAPSRVDAAVQRWQGMTGKSAVHAVTGEIYAVVAASRSPQMKTDQP